MFSKRQIKNVYERRARGNNPEDCFYGKCTFLYFDDHRFLFLKAHFSPVNLVDIGYLEKTPLHFLCMLLNITGCLNLAVL